MINKITGRLLVAGGLLLSAGLAQAVDCAAIQAKYSCPADKKFPLHLSFDDGPALQTNDVLDALRRERVPATFFALAEKIDCGRILQECKKADPAGADDGSQCVEYRQCQLRRTILNKAKQDGHMIGSHSYSHLRYSGLPPELMNRHFLASKRLLEPFMTTEPALFRLPYGDGWFNRAEKPHVLKALDEMGFMHVDWQLSAFDWDTSNQEGDKILDNVLTQVCSRKNGGIVLFHDGMDNKMHEGRLFTTANIAKWIPAMRCAVDFKPLDHFLKGYQLK
jgi:peptidoglycan/xylan/chitin deacetylase (PgdA/CDA1 family)